MASLYLRLFREVDKGKVTISFYLLRTCLFPFFGLEKLLHVTMSPSKCSEYDECQHFLASLPLLQREVGAEAVIQHFGLRDE